MNLWLICAFPLALPLVSFTSSCTAPSDSQVQFYLGTGHQHGVGHEAITHYALELASALALSDAKKEFFKPDTSIRMAFLNGGRTLNSPLNPFVQGNAATDWIMPAGQSSPVLFPELFLYYKENVAEHREWKVGNDWWADEALFHLHFLRNDNAAPNVPSLAKTCELAQGHLALSAHKAARYLRTGEHELAKLWLGTASHTIQDSYSADHSRRGESARRVSAEGFVLTGDSNVKNAGPVSIKAANLAMGSFGTVTDICTYDKDAADVCSHVRHGDDSHGDDVWAVRGNFSLRNLKPRALASVFATYEFYSTVYEQAFSGGNVDLTAFFMRYMGCANQ